MPTLTLNETVAEKLRTLAQRQRPTDLADVALILRDRKELISFDDVARLAAIKFKLVKQGDRHERIANNIEAMSGIYAETIAALAPEAPPFGEAREIVLKKLPSMLP